MNKKPGLEIFDKNHPWPDELNLKSLYKFYKYDEEHPEYLNDLLVESKLYHALPKQLNDPWECKPHWSLPNKATSVGKIRTYLINTAVKDGAKRKDAKKLISEAMKKPDFIKNAIFGSINKNFSGVRTCSFTTEKKKHLFWSHYADSHKGVCIEFDCLKSPMNMAYKIKYQKEYPIIEYPLPQDKRIFIPALTKSLEWVKEQEFRSVLIPEAENQHSNDGKYFYLHGDEIKGVYFGAAMLSHHKTEILNMLKKGPFTPRIWNANLSRVSYKLEFKEIFEES